MPIKSAHKFADIINSYSYTANIESDPPPTLMLLSFLGLDFQNHGMKDILLPLSYLRSKQTIFTRSSQRLPTYFGTVGLIFKAISHQTS